MVKKPEAPEEENAQLQENKVRKVSLGEAHHVRSESDVRSLCGNWVSSGQGGKKESVNHGVPGAQRRESVPEVNKGVQSVGESQQIKCRECLLDLGT